MNSDLVDYQLGEYTLIEHKSKIIEEKNAVEPSLFDYTLNNTSLRYEYIKSIEDETERINEMTNYLDELYSNYPLPKEWLEWYARDLLGLKYKEYEIKNMKRKYRIEQKRLKKKREEENKKRKKQDKINRKKMIIKEGNYNLNFI
jgi:hypothetical protein